MTQQPAPIVAVPLDEDKLQNLQRDLAVFARAWGAQSEQDFLQVAAACQQMHAANVALLAPEGNFAQTLAAQMAAYGNPTIPLSASEDWLKRCQWSVESIFKNRRDDAYMSAQKLGDPEFIKQSYAVFADPSQPVSDAIPPMRAEKIEEVKKALLPSDGYDAAAHLLATAEGHQREHALLAHGFDPKVSPAAKNYITALQQATPQINRQLSKLFAGRWLQWRSVRAGQVADAYRPDSPLVKEAVEECERRRQAQAPVIRVEAVAAQPVSIVVPGQRAIDEETRGRIGTATLPPQMVRL